MCLTPLGLARAVISPNTSAEPIPLAGSIDHANDEDADSDAGDSMHMSEQEHGHVRRLIFTSHLLSTWNSRVFEFGAFLFLANIYPDTLLPASIYALARAASAAVLSPWIGSYIDKTDRLRAVRISIVGQRVAVALSCVALFLLARFESMRSGVDSTLFLAGLSLLACVEKLSAVLNTISVERDWVVIVAGGHEERLRDLNAQMRRIDLFCKLIGPLAIAFVDGASPEVAIMATGCMTMMSVLVEYWTIARVYNFVPALQAPKEVASTRTDRTMATKIKSSLAGTAIYIKHRAFLPSLALALLYLTVLAFGGQMLTYLLSLGLSSGLIGVLRGISAIFEMSATWIAPRIMSHIGPVRSGIWFINWQILCVSIACAFFWLDYNPTVAAIGTVTAVIASRVGLWGFDLSAQMIVQEEVEPIHRGTFSSQEFALQNVFEMLAFASTIVFPRPAEFKYPATISAGAVAVAGVLYAVFVRSRRGHLLHWSKCVERHGKKSGAHGWTRVPGHDIADQADDPEHELNGLLPAAGRA
ncbi:unnamed protein product [Zymoseptoria tritici ST99CH_1A5]|uniref:Solute carrier family 40 member n=1 Tax=Zymoseptoria tritici ST99CH_1A5 TaxID=1276529 RepID=A0A1Y6L7C9_ZYMTR|nr:unnamed protein product [Zymoseptoria tritici ST99CH_1A5]